MQWPLQRPSKRPWPRAGGGLLRHYFAEPIGYRVAQITLYNVANQNPMATFVSTSIIVLSQLWLKQSVTLEHERQSTINCRGEHLSEHMFPNYKGSKIHSLTRHFSLPDVRSPKSTAAPRLHPGARQGQLLCQPARQGGAYIPPRAFQLPFLAAEGVTPVNFGVNHATRLPALQVPYHEHV